MLLCFYGSIRTSVAFAVVDWESVNCKSITGCIVYSHTCGYVIVEAVSSCLEHSAV